MWSGGGECETFILPMWKTKQWLDVIKQWLGWNTKKTDLLEILRASQRLKASKLKKLVIVAAIITKVYTVWHQRNRKMWKEEEENDAEIARRAKVDIRFRANVLCLKKKLSKIVTGLGGCN